MKMENKTENSKSMGTAIRIITTIIFFILLVFFSIINLNLAVHFFDGAYIILSLVLFIVFLVSIIAFIFVCMGRPNIYQRISFKLNFITLIILIFGYFISSYFPFLPGIFSIFNIISFIFVISYISFVISAVLFLIGHYKDGGRKNGE